MSAWSRLFRRRQRDDELDEEIRAHLAMAAKDRVERGEAGVDAERIVRREFGNRTLIKEVTREMWGWASAEKLRQDCLYGLRLMKRNPGFTAVATLMVALGVGANTTIFSWINGTLLNPVPGAVSPDRLAAVSAVWAH